MASKKAKKDTKKLSGILAKNIEPKYTDIVLEGDIYNEVALHVKETLTLQEASGFAQNIAQTCIDEEEAQYDPELFDFAVRLYTLYYYAGVDLTTDSAKAYDVLYCTDLYAEVISAICMSQYRQLIEAAKERISHWRKVIEASVATKVMELISKIDDMIAKSDDFIGTVNSERFMSAITQLKGSAVDVDLGVNMQQGGSQPVERALVTDGEESVNNDGVAKVVHLKKK